MSREDEELLRANYERFNEGRAIPREIFDDDFVLSDRTLPDFGADARGFDEYKRHMARLRSSFDDLRYDIEAVKDLGDCVLLKIRAHAKGAGTGIEVDGNMGHIWGFRENKATRLDVYATWGEALEAVGLRE